MRLLHARKSDVLEFETFHEPDLPFYAILSHTWSRNPDDEVLLADVLSGNAKQKPAFSKVLATVWQANEDGYTHCWVDTCCIDKSSSAELSEAINSMWRWYSLADKCYAYLEDVKRDTIETDLPASRWFTRGWTLQELLAPEVVEFYGPDWVSSVELANSATEDLERLSTSLADAIGTKETLSLAIREITNIDAAVLAGELDLSDVSIAQRMSWASERQTTRIEDQAYSLMGIFDINMPMLYGEGRKAFTRLQEEIIKSSDDASIFAWFHPRYQNVYYGLFAPEPKAFAHCGNIMNCSTEEEAAKQPWSITNRGLNLTLRMRQVPSTVEGELWYATLGCRDIRHPGFTAITIAAIRAGFVRFNPTHYVAVPELGTLTTLTARPDPGPVRVVKAMIDETNTIEIGNLWETTDDQPLSGDLGLVGSTGVFYGNNYRLVSSKSDARELSVHEGIFGHHFDFKSVKRPSWINHEVPLFHSASKRNSSVVLLIKSVNDPQYFVLVCGNQQGRLYFDAVEVEDGASVDLGLYQDRFKTDLSRVRTFVRPGQPIHMAHAVLTTSLMPMQVYGLRWCQLNITIKRLEQKSSSSSIVRRLFSGSSSHATGK